MNTQPYYITAAQRADLRSYLDSDDRTGFYLALHEFTGSEAALDMAEISSSSSLRGGVAWALNSAYVGVVEDYPPSGIREFSVRVAEADYDGFELLEDGRFLVPSDLTTYQNTKATWNRVGGENGVPDLGDRYFPGNAVIAQHYASAGDFSSAWKLITLDTAKAGTAGAALALWESFTELVADEYNYTKSLNDFLRDHPGAEYETFTTKYGAELITLKDAAGKTIGVIRGDGGLGFAGKVLDGLNNLLGPYVGMLNSLGHWFGETAFDLFGHPDGDTNSQFLAARRIVARIDPLVLDLDGDGLELTAASRATLFDHNADGIKTGTGWVRPDDGLLVRDINGNGRIDTGRELFGVDTLKKNGKFATDGFDALADLDTNGDRLITAADAAWADLRVWQDTNQDGISQAAELKSLSQLGITSINVTGSVNGPQAGQTINGNSVALAATFTQNGMARTVGAIDFEANGFFSEIPPEVVDQEGDPVTLTTAAKAAAQMRGSGMVRDLREAMSLSGAAADVLEATLARYSGSTTRDSQKAQLDSLVTDWAKTSSYWSDLETYLGGTVTVIPPVGMTEAQYRNMIAVLEAFNGTRFYSALGGVMPLGESALTVNGATHYTIVSSSHQAWFLSQAFSALKESVYDALVLQTRLKPYLDQIGLAIGDTGITLDVSTLTETFVSKMETDAQTAISDLLEINKYAGKEMVLAGWQPLQTLKDSLDSITVTAELSAWLETQGVRYLGRDASGSIEDDRVGLIVIGSNGVNQISAGGTNAQIYGGDGNDVLNGVLGDVVLDGGDGDDRLYGPNRWRGTATFIGGTGNDYLRGGELGDTYVFGLGDGRDTIDELGHNGEADVIRFGMGIRPSDISVKRSGLDLVLTHANGTDSVTITRWFMSLGTSIQIERVEFQDGTSWSAADMNVRALEIFGTDGNDSLAGVELYADVLHGGAGNDTLIGAGSGDTLDGGDGNDTLTAGYVGSAIFMGGRGDDSMNGGVFADRYIFNLGDGRDTITEAWSSNANIDVLRFGPGIVAADITARRSGNDVVFTHKNGTDMVTARNWFLDSSGSNKQIERIEFDNGDVWTASSLNSTLLEVTGTASDDVMSGVLGFVDILHGGAGNDTLTASGIGDALDGGSGDDTLRSDSSGGTTFKGGTGNDTLVSVGAADVFLFDSGDGQDTLRDYSASYAAADTLRFGEGIKSSDITALRSGTSMVFSRTGSTDQVTVERWFGGTPSLGRIEFADGGFWSASQLDGVTTPQIESRVQNLVQAMASFAPPAAAQTSFTSGMTLGAALVTLAPSLN